MASVFYSDWGFECSGCDFAGGLGRLDLYGVKFSLSNGERLHLWNERDCEAQVLYLFFDAFDFNRPGCCWSWFRTENLSLKMGISECEIG